MKQIRTEIEINASAGHVWQILMDFRSFPEWNPFIRRIEGEANRGTRLNVYLQLSEHKILFVQSEQFTGVMASLFLRSIKDATIQGFDEMNQSLKLRAEKPQNPHP